MSTLKSMINAAEEFAGYEPSEGDSFLDYDDYVFKGVQFHSPTYATLGLAGETGEVVENIKKLYRKYGEDWNVNATEEKLYSIEDELGDVLWYVTRLAQVVGTNLLRVAEVNMEKLNARQGR